MKKRMFFALGIVITASCLGLSSCGDDDDEPSRTTCTCKEYDWDSDKLIATKTDIDAQSYSVDNCSDLEDKLDEIMEGDFYYECY